MILVTGVPRSGTTPLGFFLEEFSQFPVIHEPFNYQTGISSVDRYFQFGADDQQHLLACWIERIRRYDVVFKPGLFAHESAIRSLAKLVYGSKTRSSFRRARKNSNQNVLTVKDPFLCLSLETSTEYFSQVLVTIRKPSGICNSFEQYSWYFPEVFEYCDEAVSELIDVSVRDVFGCAQFNALAVQFEFYRRLEKISKHPSITIVDMSKVPGSPEERLTGVVSALNSHLPEDFLAQVKSFYTKEATWKSKLTVHNHAQGVQNLINKGASWQVKPEYQRLFDVVQGYYEQFSS